MVGELQDDDDLDETDDELAMVRLGLLTAPFDCCCCLGVEHPQLKQQF